MRRRALLLSLPAALASGDEREDVLAAVEPLASALTQGNGYAFMQGIAEQAPNRGQLNEVVDALIAYAEMTSSVEVIRVEGGRAEVDWYMQIRARATGAVVERRRGVVKVRVSRGKIDEIEPIDFFRVPR
jgi:hypothetical protein